jgi:glycosyltransferase involved in cell wall biosynthesis
VKRYRADRDVARRELGFNDETVVIGLLGLFEPWKGHELLLDAATRPPLMTASKVRFLIAGDDSPKTVGQRQRLEERARQLGIGDRIQILGFIDDVPRRLAALDIAVAPSLRPDPLPGSVLEAMAAGLPVVASNTGGIPEMVDAGRTGFLVEPGNATALAETLARLAASAPLRAEMGRAGREVVESRFTIETSVRRLVEVYASL